MNDDIPQTDKATWPDVERLKSALDRLMRPRTNADYDMLSLVLIALILGLAVG